MSRRSSAALVWLFSAALGLAGIGAWLAGSALEDAAGTVAGVNAGMSVNAGEPLDITAYNSPALERNPIDGANLAAAARIDTPTFSCALHVSFDAGASWTQTEVPFPEGEDADPVRCYAPDVAYGADGRLHVSFVTLEGVGNTPSAVWVASSEDGGRTMGEPVRVGGSLAFQVRLVADPTDAARLYATWLQVDAVTPVGFAEAGNPVVVARSDDAGATWADPVELTDPARLRVLAPAPATGPDGHIYVAYLDLRDDRLDYHGGHELGGGPAYPGPWSLVLAFSDDGGETWEETVVDDGLVPIERVVAFLPDFPSVAVDDRGRVYVAFHDARRGDADVWVWASDQPDQAGFDEPVRVNDTPIAEGTSQHLPAVAVAPDGRVDVVYYDRRADPDDVMAEVSLQSSRDGGATFTPRLVLSDEAFDARIGFGSDRGLPDLGSRLAVHSVDGAALAVWADTREGTQASGKQVLASAVARIDTPVVAGRPVRLAGVALIVAGVLVALGGILASRRRAGDALDDPDSASRSTPPAPEGAADLGGQPPVPSR